MRKVQLSSDGITGTQYHGDNVILVLQEQMESPKNFSGELLSSTQLRQDVYFIFF